MTSTRQNENVTAHDVASYILSRRGAMTAMKLQKLLYYCQAWFLVWEDRPLFGEKIEAWINGPVIPEIYNMHKGMYQVSEWPEGNPNILSEIQLENINKVLDYYGDKTSQWLSDLTHMEAPWIKAREGLPADTRGSSEISLESMAEYYGGL